MTQSVNIKDDFLFNQINKKLFDENGQSLDGRPVWRVSWTSDQFEKRLGWHEEYSPSGNIFLRRWFGCKLCHKYSYAMDRYVLERLTFLPEGEIDKELPEIRQGSYEGIYFFQDPNLNPLPLNWRVIDLMLFALRNVKKAHHSPVAREEMLEKMYELEIAEQEAYLHDIGRSPLFAFEQTVALDSTKQFR